jgi:hypothetical protein
VVITISQPYSIIVRWSISDNRSCELPGAYDALWVVTDQNRKQIDDYGRIQEQVGRRCVVSLYIYLTPFRAKLGPFCIIFVDGNIPRSRSTCELHVNFVVFLCRLVQDTLNEARRNKLHDENIGADPAGWPDLEGGRQQKEGPPK